MYNDSPINYYREDKLNIKGFSDSLAESIINLPKRSDSIVIGLMGGWGTGKSSILNLTETKLKGYLEVLRFNPWNYYSQQMLFSSFFDELIGCLNLNDKISALFQKYKYKIIGAGISLGSTAMPELRLLDNFVPDSEYKTLNDIKNKLDELFRKQEKTVVIIDPKKVNTSKVGVGCKVTVTNIKTNASFEYSIVGDTDSDPINGLISNSSPIGAGLMGKKVGEIAIIKTPAGVTQLKVTNIKI